jgi:rhamnulokinase
MSVHLAIDLGAGSGRAFLGRVDADCLSFEEVHRFHYQPRQSGGHLRWDTPCLFDGLRGSLAMAAEAARQSRSMLASVGVDSWGVDYGLLDEHGTLVEEPIAYRDPRTAGMMEEVFKVVPRDEIFARTGLQFMELNTLFQLVAHAREGVSPRARRLLLIPDICHHVLCGSTVSEITNASTTQLLHVSTGRWDEPLFSRLGLPLPLMPPVTETGAALGTLRPDLARESGLQGLPVVAPATHDTASAVAATPLAADIAFISSGTWSLVGVERRTPLLGDAVARANFTNEAGAFGTICFLKNVTGMWLLESCRKEWAAEGRPTDLATLLAAAQAVPDFVGFVYPDSPRFFNPRSMVGEIQAALAASGQAAPADPASLARVILDSLAFRYTSVVERIESLTGAPVRGIHVVGGGSLNRYLNQATANASGRPVEAGPVEATVAGNVLVQAVATGTLPSLGEGRALVRLSMRTERYEPGDTGAWQAARARYLAVETRSTEN